ncbi:MAG: TonB-dependent receptor [Gemmatimonadota bacterium]
MRLLATHFIQKPLGRALLGASARVARTLVLTGAAVMAISIVPSEAIAQADGGRVVGRVVDGETGRALIGARVMVQGEDVGTLAGIDGRYILTGVPRTPFAVTVSYLGYGDRTEGELEVPTGGALNLDLTMMPQAVAIEGITVSAGGERGTVSRALSSQRLAIGVVNAVTSEQIARSPDGDAAAAVRRVSGVSVQDGKYVLVRGLGERYTTTSLNGSRIPSPEPEKKMVPLDLFPSGLIQSITTVKTFTPDQPGDFSGAQVDIQTREFPARREASYSYSVGFNPSVTGRTLTAAPAAGGEWLALATQPRRIPAALQNRTSFEDVRQQDFNSMVRGFRNTWAVEQQTALPSTSMAASVGGSSDLFGRRVGYLASATYSLDQAARLDEVRAVALPGADGTTTEASRYEGATGRTSVLWGGLVNVSALLGTAHRLIFDGSFNRSADNDGRRERGVDENTGADLRIDRLQYVERGVLSGRLKGEHQVGQRHRLDWGVGASSVTRSEPDRSEIVYLIEHGASGEELPAAWALSGSEVAVRTFADLREEALEASVNYRLSLGSPNRPLDLVLGGLARSTERDADNQAWSVQSLGRNALTMDRSLREQAPEEIFGESFTNPDDSVFSVAPMANGGSYRASDRVFAAYSMIEWMLTQRLQLVTGARLEHSELELDAMSTLRKEYSASPTYTDVLPALTLNLGLSDTQNLRFSVSQTLARPEYREIAPVQYREVIGGENTRGNDELRRTLIRNVDLRWEVYPSRDETMSVALFAKRFHDPIERIYLATSGTAINTFVNAAGADNYGVELEARTGLGRFDRALEPFGLFANATLMRSEIRIGNEGLASTTNPNRPMLGQSPYVLNAGLSYADPAASTSATLLYNVAGKRIVAAAGAPLPDVYEMARPTLDLSLRFPLLGGLAGKLDLQNLLDAPHRVEQGTVLREHYRSGRSISLGVTVRR